MTNFRQYVLSLPAQLSHKEPLFPGWEFSLSPHLIRSTQVRHNLPSECNSLVLVHLGNWFGRNWGIGWFIVTNATNAAPSSLKSKKSSSSKWNIRNSIFESINLFLPPLIQPFVKLLIPLPTHRWHSYRPLLHLKPESNLISNQTTILST